MTHWRTRIKVINLLSSLPDEYSTVVTALEASDQVPVWTNVIERLFHEEQKLKAKAKKPETSLVAASQSKKFKCYECGRPGHMRKNCYRFLNKNKQKGNLVQERKSKDSHSLSDEVMLYASAFSTVNDKYRNEWIVDSGASRHMCCDNSSFTDFSHLDTPQQVQVGDGNILLATGIGKVVLNTKLPNGKIKHCVLEKVLYVICS